MTNPTNLQQVSEEWFQKQKYSLGNIPNWNMAEEIKRAYRLGFKNGSDAAFVKGLERATEICLENCKTNSHVEDLHCYHCQDAADIIVEIDKRTAKPDKEST